MAETVQQGPKVFFGVEHKEKLYLPETNNEQWIELRKFSAAKRAEYFNSIGELSKAVKSEDGKYEFVPDPSKIGLLHRKMIELSVCGYNVYVMENGEPKLESGFDSAVWEKIYSTMTDDIESELLKLIYKLNPSLGVTEEKKNK